MLNIKLKKSLPGFSLDVDFSLEHEIMAIVGPSGCGKTMTLKCIAGLFAPDEGYINLDQKVLFDSGKMINLAPRERETGFVFQNYALFPHMKVFDNIAFGIRHLKRDEIQDRVSALLRKMHLEHFRQRYPGQLSGGQQQRVAIARALATEPQVLLLDEPFSALDSLVKESLQDELLELQNFFGGHVILVTHNLAEAYKLSSTLAVYETGRILQWGDKRKVIEHPASAKVARLTGVPNIFHAEVEEISEHEVTVNILELGGLFKVRLNKPNRLANKQQINVGIRPEFIEMVNAMGPNCLAAQTTRGYEEISAVVFHCRPVKQGGTQVELEVRAPRLPGREFNYYGDVYLYLPPENIFLIS